jgi:hypothetical protein
MSTSLFQIIKKNPISTVVLIGIIAWAVYAVYSDVHDMQVATTFYDYSKARCSLVESAGKSITWIVYWTACFLTYVQKQYTRWTLWVYYLAVVAFIIYYIVAGFTLDYIYAHIEPEYMDKLPALSRNLYGAPVYFMVFSFFFIPKFIKDTIKLKKEQDLTV